MNSSDKLRYQKIDGELAEIHSDVLPLPGIIENNYREAFIKQVIDSLRRIEFVYKLRERELSPGRCDPHHVSFDPIRAAIFKLEEGDIDEAIWLIFLAIHFGKHLTHGWTRVKDFYSGLEENNNWTWNRILNDKPEFDDWFDLNYQSIGGAFGNHRKYESIRPDTQRNIKRIISSYIGWVGEGGSHAQLIDRADVVCNADPVNMFNYLYDSLSVVVSFGRTAKFDFLTMVAKAGAANIAPGSAYLRGSTGPIPGAKLLLTGEANSNISIEALEISLRSINDRLSIGAMGMQVLEDSLCNWQKRPNRYRSFRG